MRAAHTHTDLIDVFKGLFPCSQSEREREFSSLCSRLLWGSRHRLLQQVFLFHSVASAGDRRALLELFTLHIRARERFIALAFKTSASAAQASFTYRIAKDSKTRDKEMAGFSVLKRLYLAIYNWIVFFGWLQVLYRALHALQSSGYESVYAAVEKPLQFAQTAAVLEIFHGLVGLVRSPVSATLPQIGSRLYVTWAVLWSFPETRTSPIVTSLVLSWSITELIRYAFFGMREAFGVSPSWLQWLRYSTFYVLYPTGISSEVGLIITSLPYVKASEKYCIRMPNKLNVAFDNYFASLATLATYIPGSPYMYMYMIGQRSKALSKSKKNA